MTKKIGKLYAMQSSDIAGQSSYPSSSTLEFSALQEPTTSIKKFSC